MVSGLGQGMAEGSGHVVHGHGRQFEGAGIEGQQPRVEQGGGQGAVDDVALELGAELHVAAGLTEDHRGPEDGPVEPGLAISACSAWYLVR